METPSRIHQQMLFDDVFVSIVRKDHSSTGDMLPLEQYIKLDHVLYSPGRTDNYTQLMLIEIVFHIAKKKIA